MWKNCHQKELTQRGKINSRGVNKDKKILRGVYGSGYVVFGP
jgi:hypothetical protein